MAKGAVASFHSEGTYEAWYKILHLAEWYMTESDIPYETLPQPVKETFKQREWICRLENKRCEHASPSRHGNHLCNQKLWSKGKQEVDLYYSLKVFWPELKLIMIRTTMKISFPQPIWTISALIKEMYPNARILDIEKERLLGREYLGWK